MYLVVNFANPTQLGFIEWSILAEVVPSGALVLAEFAVSLTYFGKAWALKVYSNSFKIKALSQSMNIVGAVGDVFITGSLIFFLHNSKSGMQSICAFMSLIMILVYPDTFLYITFFFNLSRLYSNSLLATLNARKKLQTTIDGSGWKSSSANAGSMNIQSQGGPNKAPASHFISIVKQVEVMGDYEMEEVEMFVQHIKNDTEVSNISKKALYDSVLWIRLQAHNFDHHWPVYSKTDAEIELPRNTRVRVRLRDERMLGHPTKLHVAQWNDLPEDDTFCRAKLQNPAITHGHEQGAGFLQRVPEPESGHSSLTVIHEPDDIAVPSLVLERVVSDEIGESAILSIRRRRLNAMKTIGKILPKILVQLLAVVACIGIPILEETYAPVLRERDAGDVEKAQHFHHPAVGMGKWAYMNILPHVLDLSTVFSEIYHFNTGIGGLVYLGMGLGYLVAVLGAWIADQIYQHLASKNGGVGKPEMRIPALFFGSLFEAEKRASPAGMDDQRKPISIGSCPSLGLASSVSVCMMTTFIPIQLYLVDTFMYAASALAAASMPPRICISSVRRTNV
ncbi:hypothetical protein CPB85DRAFT_1435025 [Mucidula mucida]|nr:hypothetical protein CPB85DRAFT_1435025 [Mucidula mucida]